MEIKAQQGSIILKDNSYLDIEYSVNNNNNNSASSFMEASSQKSVKDIGRWNIYESQKYLEVLKRNQGKNLIRELRNVLPGRAEPQIRAHHQKMLKKYGTIREIIRVVGRQENSPLINISQKFDDSITRFQTLIDQLKLALNNEENN